MDTISCRSKYSSRVFALARITGLTILIACVWTLTAKAQAKPSVVVSQTNWLAPFPSGRALSSGNAAGTSFAVNSNGDILIGSTFGNQVLLFNGVTGGVTVLGSFNNVGAVAVDSQNNLYVAGSVNGYIVKVPYAAGSYAKLTDPQTALPPACRGNDTAECQWGLNLYYSGNNYWFGVVSMAFDSAGDFFFATNDANGASTTSALNSSNPYSIFECGAACVTTAATGSGGNLPVKLYTEPIPTYSTVSGCSLTDTVQLYIGALAIDPWGNVFFTDSAIDTCGSTNGEVNQSDGSSLKEMFSLGSGTYSTPTTWYSLPVTNPSSYDDELDGVAVDANGTVYYATQYDGIIAFPNTKTGPAGGSPQMYGVSTTGLKVLALDSKGNAYGVSGLQATNSGSSADTLARISINNLPFSNSPVGTSASPTPPKPVTDAVDAVDSTVVMVNDADCTTAAVSVKFSESGAASSEFTGTPGACSSAPYLVAGESSFPVALTFTPAKVGARDAVLTAEDTATANRGAATAFGTGQGGMVTLDTGSTPTVFTGFTNPAGISVNVADDLFVADTGANTVFEIAGGKAAAIGSGFDAPVGTALDAGGNLYVADSGSGQIYELSNQSGVFGNQQTLVSTSVNFGGTALSGPTGIAIGPDGVLYIADTGNNRLVTFNPSNQLAGVRLTGLNHPVGIAVDGAGSLYVANAGSGSNAGDVQVYSGGGVVTTLSPTGVTVPAGVAVEASGSVLITDGPTGNIVRVPNEAGSLNSADALVIERNPNSGGGLALDVAGNLYTTDPLGATVWATQRTSASINFGIVAEGATEATILYAENAGNAVVALSTGATSFLTPPSSSMFALGAGSPVDCMAATSVAAGTVCAFTAQFSPAYGTATGSIRATTSFNSTALNTAEAPITLIGNTTYQAVTPASFSIALAQGTLSATAGQSVTTTLTVTPQGGFNSAVTFSCSGLPAGATCSFSPATVTPSGSSTATTQLMVTTSSTSAALGHELSPVLPGTALACALCGFLGFKKRRRLQMMLLVVASLAGLGMATGCGVSIAAPPVSPTSSVVTVNATSGALQGSTSFTLTVQQ